MMTKTKIKIIALILFAEVFYAQNKNSSFEDLKKQMIGQWQVDIQIRNSPIQEFHQIKGEAVLKTINQGHQIKEVFKLPDPAGALLNGTAVINCRKHYDRYEYFQADPIAHSTSILNGKFEDGQLKFNPVKNYSQWGIDNIENIEWDYVFHNNGKFTKEICMMHDYKKFLHSTYKYYRK